MLNAIKMNFYRLRKSKSTLIMIIAAAILGALSILLIAMQLNLFKENPSLAETMSTDSSAKLGIHIDTFFSWIKGDINLSEMLSSQLKSGAVLILITIFTSLFITSERKNGFIKNIGGQFENRHNLVIGQMVAAATQVFLIILAFVAASVVCSAVVWGNRLTYSSLGSLIGLFCVQYVLALAFGCLIMMIATVTRSTPVTIIIGLLISNGVIALVYKLIDYAVGHSYQIEKYVIDGNITSLGISNLGENAVRALIISLIYIVVTGILAMVNNQKRDVI